MGLYFLITLFFFFVFFENPTFNFRKFSSLVGQQQLNMWISLLETLFNGV